MTGWLALGLQAIALAFLVSFMVSTAVTPLAKWLDRSRGAAARRADVAFLLGVLPLVIGASLFAAMVLPSVLHITGLRLDHCGLHSHHAHLCALHADSSSPLLLLGGSAAIGFAVVRALRLGVRQVRATRAVSRLEGLGAVTTGPFPTTRIPGSPWVCLATGVWRPRVLLSASLETALGAQGLEAALAHEHAHLRRRDPALRIALSWAGLWAVPTAAKVLEGAFRAAAEEASDAEAAQRHGPLVVAQALVSMARLPRPVTPLVALGLGDCALERRVRVLVSGAAEAGRSRSLPSAAALIVLGGVAAIASAEAVHHVVETLLHGL